MASENTNHSIHLYVNTYGEAFDLFMYASNRIKPTLSKGLKKPSNIEFWTRVRNEALKEMNILKDVDGC